MMRLLLLGWVGLVSGRRLGSSFAPSESSDATTDVTLLASINANTLEGLVQKYDITRLSNGTMYSDEFIRFHPLVDGQVTELSCDIQLPDSVIDRLEDLYPTHRFIAIPEGILHQEEECYVEIPDSHLIRIFEPHSTVARRRLASSTGSLTALIIRVSTSDVSPSSSTAQMRDFLFNKDVCLRAQMSRCSWGKLQIVQEGPGVVDVRTGKSLRDYLRTGGNYQETIINDAESIAKQRFASQYQNADLVLFVTPTSGNWVAYAQIGGRRSVYNDHYFNYVATQMHEVGHNFFLYHANERGEYQDYSGYMSQLTPSYLQPNFPSQCFNGQNHWRLGWYPSDRTITIDPVVPSLVRLAGFAHFDRTRPNEHYVMIKVGNIFIQYNSAVGMNRDTAEYPNEVTAVADQGRGGTELVAHLTADSSSNTWRYMTDTAQGRRTFVVEVCSSYVSTNPQDPRPNQVIVSIGYDISLCQHAGQFRQGNGLFELGSPTPAPTPNPTPAPTPNPTPAPTPASQRATCKANYQPCSQATDCCSNYCMPYHNMCDRGTQTNDSSSSQFREEFRSRYNRDTYISRFFSRKLRSREN